MLKISHHCVCSSRCHITIKWRFIQHGGLQSAYSVVEELRQDLPGPVNGRPLDHIVTTSLLVQMHEEHELQINFYFIKMRIRFKKQTLVQITFFLSKPKESPIIVHLMPRPTRHLFAAITAIVFYFVGFLLEC